MSPCVRWPPCESSSERIVSPGCERRHVDGHVGLRARVRLDVRVLGAEQLLRAVDRRLLDLVDDLAAAVVAPARIALGVLVRRHRADRLEDRRPGEVLGGDQLDLVALPLELAAEQLGDRRVDLVEAGGLEVLERLLRDRHAWDGTQVTCRKRSRASAAGTAPSRRTRGSAPVRSSTVDGVPGQLAAVDQRRGAADLGRDVLERPRLRAAVQVRARGHDRADRGEHFGAGAGELRDAHADRLGRRARQPAEALLRVRQHERVRPRQQRRSEGSRELRHELEQRVDVLRQQRHRLLGRPLLQPVDLARGRLSVRVAAQPVDGVGRQHHRPPFAKRRDGLLDQARAPSRNSSTASRNCSGASTKIMWPVPGSTTDSGVGDAVGELGRADRPGDEVLLAGDHERRHRQARQQRPQVEVLPDLLLPEPRRVDAERVAVERGDVPLLPLAVVGVVERHHPAGELHQLAGRRRTRPAARSGARRPRRRTRARLYATRRPAASRAACSGPWRASVLARIRRSTRSGWLAAYSTATTPPCEWPSRSSCSRPRCSRSSSTSEA